MVPVNVSGQPFMRSSVDLQPASVVGRSQGRVSGTVIGRIAADAGASIIDNSVTVDGGRPSIEGKDGAEGRALISNVQVGQANLGRFVVGADMIDEEGRAGAAMDSCGKQFVSVEKAEDGSSLCEGHAVKLEQPTPKYLHMGASFDYGSVLIDVSFSTSSTCESVVMDTIPKRQHSHGDAVSKKRAENRRPDSCEAIGSSG